ncbi:DUF7266 family protein [Haloparvum sedimenti]|uniref:DUF7266 family protein n=1 Tax=Haloparvum sedimenti TaxID=1678448 RepID=UPI00071E8AE5|nr:hypothetical protein [Haloparvum sedimenti]
MRDALAGFGDDERGVSVMVGYVLNLAVAAILIGGLITAAGGMMDSRATQSADAQLEVLGSQVAAEVAGADRLVAASSNASTPTVAVRIELPRTVAGRSYTIAVENNGTQLVLESEDVRVTHRLPALRTPIEEGRIPGGDVEIRYTGVALEVRSA